MLFGEYAVLDGASCLAVPTRQGQTMSVKNYSGTDLKWTSLDPDGNKWFQCDISLYDFSAVKTSDEEVSKKLKKILKSAVRLNCEFLDKWKAFKVETRLEFPPNWGLGSSSSLIYMIAQWAEVSPLELYFRCENGSGYDVVCAGVDGPIEYWSTDEEISYSKVNFNPKFSDQIYFVHLNEKQSSTQGIKEYLKAVKDKISLVNKITEITESAIESSSLEDFEKLMIAHEDLIAHHTGFTKVKEERFSDYWGCVKSLGAWGGDFVMVTSERPQEEVLSYFKNKGYPTCLGYKDIIL
jgi:mevalonate kinase